MKKDAKHPQQPLTFLDLVSPRLYHRSAIHKDLEILEGNLKVIIVNEEAANHRKRAKGNGCPGCWVMGK